MITDTVEEKWTVLVAVYSMDLPRNERLLIIMLPCVLWRQHFTSLHEYKAV